MTFHAFTGMFYHELQIGTLVFQVKRRAPDYRELGFRPNGPRVRVWSDPYGTWRAR